MVEFESEYNYGDVIRGILKPKYMDDLKPKVRDLIGHEFILKADFVIDEDRFKGRYTGQREMMILGHNEELESWDFGWTPEEDIELIEYLGFIVPYGEWWEVVIETPTGERRNLSKEFGWKK